MTEATQEQQEVSEEVLEPTNPKGLAILFDENNIPEFVFTGSWCGRDVTRIKRLIAFNYRKYQQEVRKDLEQVNSQEEKE